MNSKELHSVSRDVNRILSKPSVNSSFELTLVEASLKIKQQQLELEEKQRKIEELENRIQRQNESQNLLPDYNSPLYHDLFDYMGESFIHGRIINNTNGKPIDWQYLKVNSAYENLTGLKASNIEGYRFTSIYPQIKHDFKESLSIISHTALTGQSQTFETYFYPLKKYLHINVFSSKVGEFSCTFADITGKKKIEEELKFREAILRNTNKLAHLGSWEWDVKTDEVIWSENLFEIFKLDPKSKAPTFYGEQGKFYSECSYQKLKMAVEEAATNGTPYELDLEIIKSDGERGYCTAIGQVQQDHEGRFIKLYGSVQDITERKKVENQLREHQEELETLVETKNKLFNIIAHDLRNPINQILNLTDFINNSEKKEEKAIELLKKSTHNINDLVDGLLNWSRIQSQNLKLNPDVIDAMELFGKNIELVLDLSGKKEISIINHIREKMMLYVDPDAVGIILRNLLTNAIKFTPKKGTVEIDAKRLIENNSPMIQISIKDSGIGIPSNVIDKLFKIDENHSRRGTENEKGTGLGLIICKEIVERQGGTIKIESEEGKGSTFYFTVPAKVNSY